MIAIGLWAWKRSTDTSEGYLLAGRNLHPAVAALSAGASDMSGWLLLGLPGALYASGLVEAWIGIGLFIGALANWFIVAPRLREQTESYGNALTIPEFLANRFPDRAVALRVVSALIVVVFFAVYTAAGLVGGGKLFETAFPALLPDTGLSDYMMGVWITAGVVLAYTMVGVADDLRRVTDSEVIKYSAAGFRDFTRIAASDPTMWRDVFLNNREAVLEMLGRFSEDLASLQRAIRWGDGDKLFDMFTRTRAVRRSIIEAGQEVDAPDFGRHPEIAGVNVKDGD